MSSCERNAFWGPSRLVLQLSAIDGTGCFALAAIDFGVLISEYRGERIDEAEAWRRDDPGCSDYSPYVMHLVGPWFIDGAVGGNELRYLNHSCKPNCRVVRARGRAFIVAARAIAEHEELTIDYALDQGPEFTCNCGALLCRGFPHRAQLMRP